MWKSIHSQVVSNVHAANIAMWILQDISILSRIKNGRNEEQTRSEDVDLVFI